MSAIGKFLKGQFSPTSLAAWAFSGGIMYFYWQHQASKNTFPEVTVAGDAPGMSDAEIEAVNAGVKARNALNAPPLPEKHRIPGIDYDAEKLQRKLSRRRKMNKKAEEERQKQLAEAAAASRGEENKPADA